MKKILMALLISLLFSVVKGTEVGAKSTELIDTNNIINIVSSDYEYGREYITTEPGYGFAFSISEMNEPKHVQGNSIGIRIRNNSKTPAKIKMGFNISTNEEADSPTLYQTLTANGKNQNLAIKLNGKRTFIESRNGITEIPSYFDGVLFMNYSRFGNLINEVSNKYICSFRFGGALCDNKETNLILYELFDVNVKENKDQYDKLNYELYEVNVLCSLGTVVDFKEAESTFWGGYSYSDGTPEKRAFDKSVTDIKTKKVEDINYVTYEEKWIGDVKILESFDCPVENNEELYDIYANTGAKHFLTKETIGEYNALGIQNGDWELDYTNATFSNILCYAIDGNWADFSGAYGITLLVKNFEDKFVNINIEFVGTESDGAKFRWAINFPGSRIYTYDLNTGEQSCIISNTRLFVPPHFEGWMRIPFSQYEPNKGVDPFSWVLDLDKYDVEAIYITCSMKTNPNCKYAIANLGLYYEDFKQESFFEEDILTIKDCLEIENYKEKRNENN